MLMKKIFTLIATALMTLGVNAQSWNFSDWEVKEYTEPAEVNGLKINAADNKKISIDENSKTVDEVTYTKRLKLGGSGSATSRNIGFTAAGAGTLKVILTSASSSDDRTLGVSLGETEIGTATAKGGVVEAATVEITGAGEVTIYSKQSGINLYLVEFTPAGGPIVIDTDNWDASTIDFGANISESENSNPNWKKVPSVYPGEAPSEEQIIADATAPLILKDYTFTVKSPNVTFIGVSTPNSPNAKGEQDDPWHFGTNRTNQYLNTDDGPVKFAGSYVKAKAGNPSLSASEYFFTNSDGGIAGPRYVETLYTPDCGQLPKKGEYYEIKFDKAGSFIAGIFLSRAYRHFYIVDKETTKPLTPSSITFNGYNNNNTVVLEGADAAYNAFKVNDDYTVSPANPAITLQDKEVFGFININVEAKTYLMFSSDSQLGIYGFQFTPGGDPAGVETIKTNNAWNANAPMYNLSGQKVDKSYKGIVIQNGRKFVNK